MKKVNREEPLSVSLEDLAKGFPFIPPECGMYHAQAALVCFSHCNHASNIVLKIDGGFDRLVRVRWKLTLDSQMKGYWKDMKKAAEEGAVGIAFLLMRLLAGYSVLERAVSATGIDWWLGKKGGRLFQKKARLEVSGILEGTRAQVERRMSQKKEQTKQSDESKLDAYVVVVEFFRTQVNVGEAMSIKEAEKKHHQAMVLVDQSLRAKLEGEVDAHVDLVAQAFRLEKEAASLVAGRMTLEPTRSILHRSAASLAMQCGKPEEAEKLIATALSGSPPFEIAEELRDLLEEVLFHRHLGLKGITLEPDEFQLSLSGRETGFGIVHTESFRVREQNLELLILRTAARKRGKQFDESGLIDPHFPDSYLFFMSVPRAASFAVTLKIGRPHRAQPLPQMGHDFSPGEVLEEVVTRLAEVERGEEEATKRAIPDPAYFRNFLGLARNLAPDGKEIKSVGITLVRAHRIRELSLTKPQRQIPKPPPESPLAEGVIVKGVLRFADDTHKNGTIKVIDKNGKAHIVLVPEGMMDDIVRPLWKCEVEIEGTRNPRASIPKISLSAIRPATSDEE